MPPALTEYLCGSHTHVGSSSDRTSDVEQLFTTDSTISENVTRVSGLTELSAVARFIPYIVPKAFGGSEIPNFWRAEFAESALHRWLKQHQHVPVSELLLSHMVLLSCHANLELLQFYATSRSHHGFKAQTEVFLVGIREWSAAHRTISRWNAARIITLMQESQAGTMSDRLALGDTDLEKSSSSLSLIEAPHVAYCVYYATLVLWCGSLLSNEAATTQALHLRYVVLVHETAYDETYTDGCVLYVCSTGACILATLRPRIGRVLSSALKEIMP